MCSTCSKRTTINNNQVATCCSGSLSITGSGCWCDGVACPVCDGSPTPRPPTPRPPTPTSSPTQAPIRCRDFHDQCGGCVSAGCSYCREKDKCFSNDSLNSKCSSSQGRISSVGSCSASPSPGPSPGPSPRPSQGPSPGPSPGSSSGPSSSASRVHGGFTQLVLCVLLVLSVIMS